MKKANTLYHNENYASCIDKVYRYDDNTFFLGDIKTTYKLNKEYVQWQLSIYAHLFEKETNKGAKVSSIFAIWLRGTTHQIVELERIPDEKVKNFSIVIHTGFNTQKIFP